MGTKYWVSFIVYFEFLSLVYFLEVQKKKQKIWKYSSFLWLSLSSIAMPTTYPYRLKKPNQVRWINSFIKMQKRWQTFPKKFQSGSSNWFLSLVKISLSFQDQIHIWIPMPLKNITRLQQNNLEFLTCFWSLTKSSTYRHHQRSNNKVKMWFSRSTKLFVCHFTKKFWNNYITARTQTVHKMLNAGKY